MTLDGQRITTTDLLGHVLILTFWATWCTPCRDELPLLSSYAVEACGYGTAGARLLSGRPGAAAPGAPGRAALSFPVGLLANSSAPGYGRIWRLPVNFTIDQAGRLIDNGWKGKRPAWTRSDWRKS